MKKELIIVGASGFGREVAWLVERINQTEPTWDIKGFIDDDENIQGTVIGGYPVIGTTETIKNYPNAWYVCAIGASIVRQQVIEKLGSVKFATLVDPSVLMSERVSIGEGTIICANTVLTVDIRIGRHVIINLDCTIGHDAVLEDYVTLYPSVNVSGLTHTGECSEIGTGTQIIQKKRVGTRSVVGAGAVVVKDIPNMCTAVGSPAKPIKFFSEEFV